MSRKTIKTFKNSSKIHETYKNLKNLTNPSKFQSIFILDIQLPSFLFSY